jgi:vancomycin resistance protein YoaR
LEQEKTETEKAESEQEKTETEKAESEQEKRETEKVESKEETTKVVKPERPKPPIPKPTGAIKRPEPPKPPGPPKPQAKTVTHKLGKPGKPKLQETAKPEESLAKTGSFRRTRKFMVGAMVAGLLIAGSAIAYAMNTFGLAENTGIAAMIQGPSLKLQYGKETYSLPLEEVGYDGKNPATINKAKFNSWVEKIKKDVEKAPENAKLNGKKLGDPIIPEKLGIKVDTAKLESMLQKVKSIEDKPQPLPVIKIQPEITAADYKNVEQELLGKYTTYYGSSAPGRKTNIKLAVKTINGMVLNPGEEFSFNGVVGERRPDRGYKPAPVLVRGKHAVDYGGGICQVSTTLYNAIDRAGIKSTMVIHHSANVGYVPVGRDATVSWNGPDYKFVNNFNKPILIKILADGATLSVKIYSVPGAEAVDGTEKKNIQDAPSNVPANAIQDPADNPNKAKEIKSPATPTNKGNDKTITDL